MHSHNDRYLEDTYRPCPDGYEDPVVNLPATERMKVNKEYTEHHNDREEFEAIDQSVNDPYSITLRRKPGEKSIGAGKE